MEPQSLLLTSMPTRTMKQLRYSKLQNIILRELSIFPDKVAHPEDLSLKVAKIYAPEKIWRLEDCRPEIKVLAQKLHRKTELVRNIFSVSFSRALRSLEQKGKVKLVKGKWTSRMENGIWTFYRLKTPQPRVTLVVASDSPYFKSSTPDIDRFIEICNSCFKVKYADVSTHVNNNQR